MTALIVCVCVCVCMCVCACVCCRWIGCVAVLCMVVLVLAFNILGLLCGTCGYDKQATPTTRGCLSNTGGNLLMAYVSNTTTMTYKAFNYTSFEHQDEMNRKIGDEVKNQRLLDN